MMHFPRRSSMAFSIIGALALVGALAAVAAPSAHAAARTVTASYNGHPVSATRVATSTRVPGKHITSTVHNAKNGPLAFKDHSPGNAAATARARATVARGALPHTAGAAIARTAQGQQLANFNGLSDLDQTNANGGQGAEVTPPDQALCVGSISSLFGGHKVVLEIVNDAGQVFTTGGTPLTAPISVATLFQDPGAFSDPRCLFDPATQTFFLTIIGLDSAGNTFDDVSVINSHGQTTYRFPTAAGNNCFGDQPHTGFDNNAVYVTTDQFCGANQDQFDGALVVAISKPQLVNQDLSVHALAFGPVSLGGVPILTLEPAFGDGTNTEYLVNSFPFDQFGNSNSIANTLGLWQVTGDRHLTTGGTVTLTGRIITSETYAFPMPAASTGTGAVTCVPFIVKVNCPAGVLVESEPFLDGGDSRMQQVQFLADTGGPRLFAELDTAITIGNDPSARDGIAWFEINPAAHKITDQGYIAAAGKYLLYPALIHTLSGTSVITFSMTSPTLNPSTAFVVRKAGSKSFGSIQTTGAGTGPHMSFAGPLVNRVRWGDYSFSVLDPNGINIWGAAEYIPPAADQDPVDNWGTRVWDVAGAH